MSDQVLQGYWWTADDPEDRVAGSLLLESDGSASLTLFGHFGDNHFSFDGHFPFIYGLTSGSPPKITLEDSRVTNISANMPGFNRTTFSPNRVLRGDHLNPSSRDQCYVVDVSVTCLREWLGQRAIDYSPSSENGFLPQVSTKKLEPVRLLLCDYDICFTHFLIPNMRQFDYSITQRAIIRVRSSKANKFDSIVREVVEPIRLFLSLATGYSNRITSTSAYYNPKPCLVDPSQAAMSDMSSVSVYMGDVSCFDNASAPAHGRDMLFSYHDVATKFPGILERWMLLNRETSPVLWLVLEALSQDNINIDSAIQKLTSALECLHRSIADHPEIEMKEFEEKLALVQEGTPEELRPWVKEKMRYANSLSLRTRVEEIIDMAGETAIVLLGDGRTSFAQKVVATRNYLAHLDRRRQKHVLKGVHQFRTCEVLAVILKTVILRKIGFTDSECLELWNRNHYFTFLCGRFDEVVREWRRPRAKASN